MENRFGEEQDLGHKHQLGRLVQERDINDCLLGWLVEVEEVDGFERLRKNQECLVFLAFVFSFFSLYVLSSLTSASMFCNVFFIF